MREIKFKFYCEESCTISRAYTIEELMNGKYDFHCDINKAIKLQYTEKKDKNGVEIYEGDICKIKYSKDSQKNSLCEESVGLVEYFDSSFWLNNKKDKFSVIIDISEELKVIGNIYENQELLES